MPSFTEIAEWVRADNWREVKSLVDGGFPINTPVVVDGNEYPATLLQRACVGGSLKVVEVLLERGASLKFSKWHGSALYAAVAYGPHPATIAKILLDCGANANAKGPALVDSDSGWTALLCAAFRDKSECAELLLNAGADPKIASKQKIGVVACAVEHLNVVLTKRFLAAGAPAIGNALFSAIEKGQLEVFKLLLSCGSDPNTVAGKIELSNVYKGQTPLSFAIQCLSFAKPTKYHLKEPNQVACLREMIADLLQAKADPNRIDHNRTPLSIAILGRDVQTVRLLLAAGANVRGETYSDFLGEPGKKSKGMQFYETALHQAIRERDKEIIAELIKAGADITAPDHTGTSARELAIQTGYQRITKLFDV